MTTCEVCTFDYIELWECLECRKLLCLGCLNAHLCTEPLKRSEAIKLYITANLTESLASTGKRFGVSREYIRQLRAACGQAPIGRNSKPTCIGCGTTVRRKEHRCQKCFSASKRFPVTCTRCGRVSHKYKHELSNPRNFAGYDRYLCRPCRWRVGEPDYIDVPCSYCGSPQRRLTYLQRYQDKRGVLVSCPEHLSQVRLMSRRQHANT